MKYSYLLSTLALLWGVTPINAQKYNQGEASHNLAETQKREIKAACDFAATIDVSENDEFHLWYDDKGNRFPIPKNAKKAITDLEGLIERMPNYPEMACCYLHLGNLRNKYQADYRAIGIENNGEWEAGTPPEIAPFAEQQYFYYSPGESYSYNGWHYDRLISLFPNSDLVDDAAYEKTHSEWCGETMGVEIFEIECAVDPHINFLARYPSSDFASKAIQKITKGFSPVLTAKDDRISDTKTLPIGELKKLIEKFETAASALNAKEKATAYDVLSALWEKTGEKEKAIAACKYILSTYPKYPSIQSIRERMQRLNPSTINSDGRGKF